MNALPASIADLVDHWGHVAPEREAIRFGPDSWTWAEVAARVERNSSGQSRLGLRPGDRVACLDKNGPALLETALACLRAGTVLTPVNFRLTPTEIQRQLEDAEAQLLLVGAEFVPLVTPVLAQLRTPPRVIVVGGNQHDQYEPWLLDGEADAGGFETGSGETFLQVYTAGTTGFPRGAMLTEANLTAQATAIRQLVGVEPDSIGMAALPLFHVAALAWALTLMYSGATTVLVRDIEPVSLLNDIVEQKITHIPLVPVIYDLLLRVPGVADRDYSHLKALVYGASPMPMPLLRRCLETFRAPIFQGYGMTEAASVVTMLGPDEHRDETNQQRLGSAGRPVPGVELIIADPVDGRRLEAGASGEIRVRSAQVMAGYWRAPEPDPSVITAEGWLRTGDVGYLDGDGYLYVIDRIKDMYISGGENIYPAEVERVLVEHPEVAEVAVIGVPDETWGEVGRAFVVPASVHGTDVEVDEAALLRYCREQLTGAKCPASVVVVRELPRNAAGKVLKRALE